MGQWTDSTALVVIDVQKGFDDPRFGGRNNPSCEANIERLLAAWRLHGWPVVFVRHDSTEQGSSLRPGQAGNDFKDILDGEPDVVISKTVHSAFYGKPDLHEWLQRNEVNGVAICGIQTNICCETTARMASDLGYEVLFVIDATYTFDTTAPDGVAVRARDLSRMTATNLAGEFARVVTTKELVG